MASSGSRLCVLLSSDAGLQEELSRSKLPVTIAKSDSELIKSAKSDTTEAVVLDGTGRDCASLGKLVKDLHRTNGEAFICVYGSDVGRDPHSRIVIADNGGAMTTWSASAVRAAVDCVYESLQCPPNVQTYACPYCKKSDLSEDGLWLHSPLYHLNEPNKVVTCPICLKRPSSNIQVHIHNDHGPPGRGEMESENQPDTTLYAFGLVVCQRSDGKFLLVQEFTNSGFWMPGGRLNPGEGLFQGAKREALEEAGIDVEFTGLLKLEFLPSKDSKRHPYTRLRCVLLARPADPKAEPKSIPDFESVGATWVSLEEMRSGLRLRSNEPHYWAEYLAAGKPVHSLSLLDTV